MKKEVKELKRIARKNITGHYKDLIRTFIFCNVIVSLIELPFSMMTNNTSFSTQNIIYYVACILIGIASVILTAGQYRIHLKLARTGEMHLSELFIPLKYHSNRFLLTEFLLFGLSLVCMLPIFAGIAMIIVYKTTTVYIITFILGIISFVLATYLSLCFDLVYFVMNDIEELDLLSALKYTKKLVHTHKGRYLYMQLSFLGMILLSGLSLGIGFLWVQPYMVQTTTLFYLDVRGELKDITPEPVAFDQYI